MKFVLLCLIIPSCLILIPKAYWQNFRELILRCKFRPIHSKGASFYDELCVDTHKKEARRDYKFFSNIVGYLYTLRREYGAFIEEPLKFIKKGVLDDIKAEKRLYKLRVESYLQMLMICFISWAFYFAVKEVSNFNFSNSDFFIVISLQGSGLLLFYFLEKIIRNRIFKNFNLIFKRLYIFSSLLNVGLSQSEVIKKAQMEDILNIESIKFKRIISLIEKKISNWRESGDKVKDDFDLIIEESWFLYEQSCESFTKYLSILGFIILALFFLPSYFYLSLGGVLRSIL